MCCAQRVARPADSLPDDIDALRALALNAIAESDAAIAERDQSGPAAFRGTNRSRSSRAGDAADSR
jgi:hypothetical protein